MEAKTIPTIPAENFLTKNLFPFFEDPLNFTLEKNKVTNNIFHVNLPFTEVLMVSDPIISQTILQNKNGNYRKGFSFKQLRLSLGNGLVTNNDESWFTNRKLINPFFHKQALEGYLKIMEEETYELIEEIKKIDGEVDLLHLFGDLTLNIVLKSIVHEEDDNIVKILRDAVNHANGFLLQRIRNPLRLPLWVPTKENSIFLEHKKNLDREIYKLIEQRKKEPKEDILSMLVNARDEEGNGLSDEQIRDEVVTLLVAGHETTANALGWTFFLLSKNPEVQEKALVAADEAENLSSWAGVQKNSYIKQVIQEGMRILPPVWSVNRQAIEEDIIEGYKIPKGREVFISIHAIHNDPGIWHNPEMFEPERFSPENEKSIDKSCYLPFGLGPRFCIGSNFALSEMIVVTALILKNFRILRTDHNPILNPLITLTSANGIMLKLTKR